MTGVRIRSGEGSRAINNLTQGLSMTDTIIWTDVAKQLPDADETVLIYSSLYDPGVGMGYLDGEQWRDAGDGWPIAAPSHWASMPKGPKQ